MDARWEITLINSVHIEKKLSIIENIYFMSYFMSFFDFLIFIRSGIIQQERTNILDRLWNVRYVVQLQKPLHALLELVQLTSQLLPLLCQSITGNTHLTYFNILFQLYCIETYDNKNSNIQYKYCDFFFLPKLTEMLKKILAVSHLRRISGIFSLYQAFGHQNLFHTVKATTILACTIIHRILLQVTS